MVQIGGSSPDDSQAASQSYPRRDVPFDGMIHYQQSGPLAAPNLTAFWSLENEDYDFGQEDVSPSDDRSDNTEEMTDGSASPVLPGGYRYSLDFLEPEQTSCGARSIQDSGSEAIEQPLSNFSSTTASWKQPSSHATKDCFRKLCEAFQYLKKPQNSVCVYDASNDAYLGGDAPDMRNIGEILRKTGEVMNVVSLIIKCPCHTTSKVRCALTLLLLDVVSWYESIAKDINGSRNSGENRHIRLQHDLMMPAGGTMPDELIQPDFPPVCIGSTMLGLSDTLLMLSQVILFKIRQIRNIMQNLSLPPSSPVMREQALNNLAASLEAEMFQDPIACG